MPFTQNWVSDPWFCLSNVLLSCLPLTCFYYPIIVVVPPNHPNSHFTSSYSSHAVHHLSVFTLWFFVCVCFVSHFCVALLPLEQWMLQRRKNDNVGVEGDEGQRLESHSTELQQYKSFFFYLLNLLDLGQQKRFPLVTFSFSVWGYRHMYQIQIFWLIKTPFLLDMKFKWGSSDPGLCRFNKHE